MLFSGTEQSQARLKIFTMSSLWMSSSGGGLFDERRDSNPRLRLNARWHYDRYRCARVRGAGMHPSVQKSTRVTARRN
jgi:hypothetical protein